ncbi:MAG: aldo/keto reductase [Clostridia bacterium]|nr:aldo/keto reductase [Clostridia bacterium]
MGYFGEDTPKLGFGLMRLPKLEDGKTIDIEQTKTMVDMFMKAGQTYYDTAYVYDGGESEKATKLALVDRYPRDSYTLATKLNAWHMCNNMEEAKNQINISLERTGAGYFDYYLLHAIMDGNVHLYDEYDLWNYAKQLKADGKVKHWGFSFHGTPELLEKLLTEHPDIDFIQLQLNYADWEDEKVASRKNWEIARKHGVSIVVMEPVKGGALANPPAPVAEVLKNADPDASYASWAIRYVASLDGIITVLSGMSNIAQMEDNLSYMADFRKLNAEEAQVIEDAKAAFDKVNSIKCTACHYCTEGCPMQIKIPEVFAARNQELIWSNPERAKREYDNQTKESLASTCIACGQCESACPQGLPIIDLLKDISAAYEN